MYNNTASTIRQINCVNHLVVLFIYLRIKFEKIVGCFLNIRFKLITALLIIVLSVSSNVHNARAADVLDTILDTLEGLTCETNGVGNLLRSEFSHTCIPASFFTFLIANIVSPGLYANTFLRVTINDDELFPGACDRGNRIDFNDQKLSFSMCNNIDLAVARVGAIKDTIVVIAKAFLTNSDPWDDIQDAWKLPKSEYHKMFLDKREGDSGVMYDVGIIPVFPWKVIKENDKMCVATQSFGGWIPIGCKYIKEPYPVSIYSEFMDLSPEGMSELANLTSLTTCGNMGGCYKRAYDNSRTGIVMTGPLIECVKEMIAKLMISSAVCSFDDVQQVLGSNSRHSSALFQFQRNMHKIVSALLTIYVILFGFKIVLAGDIPPKSELVNFLVKFLFVVYFSVGININVGSGDDLNRMDGMIQWAFPFLLNGMNQMAGWMMNASPSELCKFDDVYYPDSLRHLQLWDALDCKVSHYLGLDAMQTMIVENASRNHDWKRFDVLSFPIPPYIYLLIPAIISGNFTLISLALMYPLLVISVAAFIVNATVVCMISIVVLGILAPLFVPLYLFDYTKGYFEAWVKLLISFLLQPMVAVVFMTTMLSVYDFGFYGTCKYTSKDFTYTGPEFKLTVATGIGQASVGVDSRTVRYSYLDQDWEKYTEEEKEGCQNSLGFILNNPFQFLYGTGEDLATSAVMPWIEDASGDEEKKRSNFLDAVSSSPGMFFSMVEVIFEKIKTLVLAMLTACLVLYLMYHFSESLAEFAADMTEGVSIANMAIKPQAVFKAGMAALGAAGGASGGGDAAASGGDGGGADKMSTSRGGGASDKMSTGGGGSSDKMSTGGGGGASSDKMSTGGGGGGSEKIAGKLADKMKGAGSKVGSGLNPSDSVKASAKGEDVSREAPVESGKSENSESGESASDKVTTKDSSDGNLDKGEK